MPVSPIKQKVDTSIEKRIIVGMIVSKPFLYEIREMLDINYLQSSFTQRIARWCIDFFDTYEEAPFTHIQDVYNKERLSLPLEESQLIGNLLTSLSDKFEQEKDLNVDYLVGDTIYLCTKRQLEITISNASEFLARGTEDDIKAAQDEIMNYMQIAKSTSTWVNPFDEKEIEKVFREKAETFFKFPGQIGDFLGNMEREWLIGISAPFKRGKTWFLEEFGIIGMLSGLRVAFFSLEMKDTQIEDRIYKRLMSTSDEGGIFIYPCFDCKKNQFGLCTMNERENFVPLVEGYDPTDEDALEPELPEYDSESDYKPCTYCRGKHYDQYEKATWYVEYDRPAYTQGSVSRTMAAFKRQYGSYFRIKAFPKFSANVDDIERELNVLERTQGFIPDMILVDMVDTLMPQKQNMQGVAKEDEAWMCLARLGGKRKALIVTPTQVSKEALEATQLTQMHTARWVGKLGHVDGMITLNQTPEEKRRGVMRVGMMAHRHEDFDEGDSVTILQQLTLGQVNLDSER